MDTSEAPEMLASSRSPVAANGDVVRLVVISDTHNRHGAVARLLPPPPPPPGEEDKIPSILIHCGDFADRGNLEHVKSFCRWLSSDETSPTTTEVSYLPSHYEHVVIVHGNHDISRPPAPQIDLETEFTKCQARIDRKQIRRRIHYLRNQSIQLYGVTIHGMMWETSLQHDYRSLVGSPDVLLSHANPYLNRSDIQEHVLDLNIKAWKGLLPLTQVATERRIPLVMSGHVHWGRGVVRTSTTAFVNASTTKPGLREVHNAWKEVTAPVVIDYHVPHRTIVDCWRIAYLACSTGSRGPLEY